MKNLRGVEGIWAVRMGRYSLPNASKGKEIFLSLGMQVLARA
jgi:hypothetical protein